MAPAGPRSPRSSPRKAARALRACSWGATSSDIVLIGRTVLPLTRQPGALQAWKVIIPATQTEPDPRAHEGYEWLYVLSGRLRLVLGDHDLMLNPGEAAEFATRLPHWFGSTGGQPVEILSILGRQGERMHVRAKPRQDNIDDR
jgi:mannose-6-phosphate isomerase-like protein (cupin superfamily)